MSILTHHMRPAVNFDPHNEQHRKHYYEFVKTGSWAKCPVIFQVPGLGNPASVMQRMLVEAYLEDEFTS
jgi:hypothetical protein